MEKKTVRTGIVGAGFAARFHYEAVRKVYGTNVDVKGVYAIDTDQAAEFAAERGIRAPVRLPAFRFPGFRCGEGKRVIVPG